MGVDELILTRDFSKNSNNNSITIMLKINEKVTHENVSVIVVRRGGRYQQVEA